MPRTKETIRTRVMDEALYLLEDLPAALLCGNNKLHAWNESCGHVEEIEPNCHEHCLYDGKGKKTTSETCSPALYSAASTASFESSLCENSSSEDPCAHGEERFLKLFGCFNMHSSHDREHLPPPNAPSPPTQLHATTTFHSRKNNFSNPNVSIQTKDRPQHVLTESCLTVLKGMDTHPQVTYCIRLPEMDSATTDTEGLSDPIEISTSLMQLLDRGEIGRPNKKEEPNKTEEEELVCTAEAGFCGHMLAAENSQKIHDKTGVKYMSEQLVFVERQLLEHDCVGMRELREKHSKKDIEEYYLTPEESIFTCWRRRPILPTHACV
jgi:hypothetical protein